MTSDLKSKIVSRVTKDLEKIELTLADNLSPNLKLVKEVASHLLFSGGKRLRPLLMVHSARICGYNSGFEIEFSTIFEFLHAATLLHDDVVDKADIRRGKATAHTCWSAPKVVLTGDFLLATALDIAARTEKSDIISVIAHITGEMSQGEIDQMEKKGEIDLSEAQYLKVIERKTAVLIQGACQSGAILAEAPDRQKQALKDYGYHLGLAFQMADDLLDYTATAKELGKNPGADIREGKLTLPLIATLAKADENDKEWIINLVKAPLIKQEQFEQLKEALYKYKGIEYTSSQAQHHVDEAKTCLDCFDESPSRELLLMLADYSIERKV
jgi:octaprenyl-diphosphate synthase